MSGSHLQCAPVGRCFFLYNTVCQIVIYAGPDDATALLDAAQDAAQEVQRLLDRYDPSSELARLNTCARPGVPYPLSPTLFTFFQTLQNLHIATGGVFDPTVAELVRLWAFKAEHPRIPAPTQIGKALTHTGFSRLHLNGATHSITLPAEGMALDFGGAGKGYAAACIAAALKAGGVTCAAIDLGGSLCLLGDGPGEDRAWEVNIQRPWSPRGESIGTLRLQGGAVSTSGAYERYFKLENTIYHHILDPRTGWPAQSDLQGVTAVSPDPLLADVASTALFIAGRDGAARLAGRLRTIAPLEYLLVTEKETILSEGLQAAWTPKGA